MRGFELTSAPAKQVAGSLERVVNLIESMTTLHGSRLCVSGRNHDSESIDSLVRD